MYVNIIQTSSDKNILLCILISINNGRVNTEVAWIFGMQRAMRLSKCIFQVEGGWDCFRLQTKEDLAEYCVCRYASAAGNFSELHWLPMAQRIEFKVLTLMHGAVHNGTPQYLSDRISTYTPARTLRSESQSLAVVPRINLEHYGR